MLEKNGFFEDNSLRRLLSSKKYCSCITFQKCPDQIRITALALCAAAALFAAPIHAEDAADWTRKEFDAKGAELVVVKTERGAIEVSAGGGRILVEKIPSAAPDKCEFQAELADGTLLVSAASPGLWIKPGACSTGFKIRVPAKTALELSSGTGDMTVSGVAGGMNLASGTGRVEVRGVTGPLTVRGGTGAVEGVARVPRLDAMAGSGAIRLRGLTGSAVVRSGSGAVRLEWASAPKRGEADVRTGSGDVALFFPARAALRAKLLTAAGDAINEIGETEGAAFTVSVLSGSGNAAIRKMKRN